MVTQLKIQYKSIIKAPLEKVWEALTSPEIVKQYFFNTDLVTTWEIESPIYFQGEWEGQKYQDKGKVLEYEHNKRLAFSYLASRICMRCLVASSVL